MTPIREWMAAHAIDFSLAAAVGLRAEGDALHVPYGRSYERVRRFPGNRFVQPSGERLGLFTPAGNRAAHVLLCEGEGDTLAAASVLCEAVRHMDERNGYGSEWWTVEPRDDLPGPLAGLLPVGIPGAGTPLRVICGELIAMGAEQVLVCFDGDEPGRKKQREVIRELTTRHDIEAVPLHLPDGTDLADCLRGAEDRADWLAHLVADGISFAAA